MSMSSVFGKFTNSQPLYDCHAASATSSGQFNVYPFTAPFLASLQSDAARAEYVDLLKYLFVEWATVDARTAAMPVTARHDEFLRELQAFLTFSPVMGDATLAFPAQPASEPRNPQPSAAVAAAVNSSASSSSVIVKNVAAGAKGAPKSRLDDFVLPTIRHLAEQRLHARYALKRADRYRPRPGRAVAVITRSMLESTYYLLAVEDAFVASPPVPPPPPVPVPVAADEAPKKRVAFRVMPLSGAAAVEPAAADSPTTIRVVLPSVATVPTDLPSWRRHVRDMSARADAPTRCEFDRAFAVLCPRSGTVHCVTIASSSSCTCEANSRVWQTCSHILFILVRVLRVPLTDHMLYQRALVREERFAAHMRRVTLEALADNDWRNGGQRPGTARPLALDDECRICFKRCTAAKQASGQVPFCASCGRNFHGDCLQIWRQQQDAAVAPNCPICLGSFAAPPAPGE
jgi:hypothetical protein